MFSFGFIEALDSKGIINKPKSGFRQPWNARTVQVSFSLPAK